ncbi:hypothetical protein B5G42_14135 [Flavonifractor sp. An91]|nr:hypothetical protein B5G42_14135 [Flavonifractor sp. An91]
MCTNNCMSSVTPLFPNDSKCNSNVSQCHDCPFAVCNPLRYRTMEQKLRNAIAYLDGWANGTYIVAVDTNDFDVINHRYDLRAVIAGLNVILHEALSLPLGDLPRWEDQYPVHLPVDTTQVKRQKGRD